MVVKKLLKDDLNVCKATEKFLFNFQSNIHRVELNRWVILNFFLGIIGSSHYRHLGGGGEYICLPKVPKYDKYKDGYQSHSYIYGTEYEVSGFNPFKNSLHDHDAPCAVCYVSSRATQLMIPARNDYPPLGPKSTMGTWCRSATTTNSHATSFALTETRSLFTAAVQTSMVPFCTLWKVSVARCHAYLMLVVGNWLALYAPSDESTVEKLFRH